MKVFSIIIPIYQNALNIPQTLPDCLRFAQTISNYTLEFIFVDDGSTDGSYELLQEYHFKYPQLIKVIKFTKNSGQPAATLAGMIHSRGDVLGVISADMQDPIDLFKTMLLDWEAGKKLVIASRNKRSDGFIGDLMSNFFYHLINRYAVKGYPKGGFDYFLVDRAIVRELEKVKEQHGHIVMLIFSFGFSYSVHFYERKPRLLGKSQYSFWKKIKVVYDAFMANSYAPIRFVTTVGIISSLSAFIYGLFIVANWLMSTDRNYTGWPTIVVLISFFSGLILMSLGILGEYIWRIYEDVRCRPRFIIDKMLDIKSNPQSR